MQGMLNQTTDDAGRTPGRAHAGNLALTLSALALVVLILTMAGRGASRADAAPLAEVSQSGDYTALTCDGGNEDILVVLDGRTEQLFVYKVVNQTSVQLYQREDVARLFGDARAKARGAGTP